MMLDFFALFRVAFSRFSRNFFLVKRSGGTFPFETFNISNKLTNAMDHLVYQSPLQMSAKNYSQKYIKLFT